MMKKMLVLALVLAVAGLANAGLDLSTVNGLSYSYAGQTVTVSSTLPVLGYGFALKTDNGSALSGAVIPSGFGVGVNPGFMTGGQWDGVSASVGDKAPVTGNIFSINFAAGVQKIYFVYSTEAFDGSAITLGGAQVYLSSADTEGVTAGSYEMVVPEPMTMGLLALGALFLRKK